jgi:hypothetical protein
VTEVPASAPAPTTVDSTSTTRILLAAQLEEKHRRFLKRWREGDIDFDDLRSFTRTQFQSGTRLSTFLNTVAWVEKMQAEGGYRVKIRGELVALPITLNSTFLINLYETELGRDTQEMLRTPQVDILSTLSFRVGTVRKDTLKIPPDLSSELGLL